MKAKIAIASLLAAIAVPVLAQPALPATPAKPAMPATPAVAPVRSPTALPGIDQRQAIQERRIEQGVKSGQLTQQEAARLEKRQQRIQAMEDKAKADGKVTASERERIQRAQDKQSQQIYREKHDAQRDLNHDGRNDKRERKENRGKHIGQKKHDR